MTRNHETWEEQLDHHRVNSDIAAMLRAGKKVEEAVRVAEHREVRIATLVEAAALVCLSCERGERPLGIDWWSPSGKGDLMSKLYHYSPDATAWSNLCDAEPIILKLVEEWA